MDSGIVKWFDESRGFGSIAPTDGSADVLVHFSAINGSGFRALVEDQSVSMDVERGPKGLQAARVTVQDYRAPREPPRWRDSATVGLLRLHLARYR